MVALPLLVVGGGRCVPPPLMVTTSDPGAPKDGPSLAEAWAKSARVFSCVGASASCTRVCVPSLLFEGFPEFEKGVANGFVFAPLHSLPFALSPPVLVLRQRGKPNLELVPFQNRP